MTDKWIRTCQECGNKQEDSEPSRAKELSTAYLERKCKKCKSGALDYGSNLSEPQKQTGFSCDKCGQLDHVLLDGYPVGDTLLEGVLFEIRREDGKFTATIPFTARDYMAKLNPEKWCMEVAVYASETDTASCPKCGVDVDLSD